MIAQQLVILRKQNKLTQVQVARFLGVERSTYCRYEADERKIDVYMLKKLSNFYGIPLSVLLEDDTSGVLEDNERYEEGDTFYLSQLSKDERDLIVEYRRLNNEEKKEIADIIKNK